MGLALHYSSDYGLDWMDAGDFCRLLISSGSVRRQERMIQESFRCFIEEMEYV